MRSITSTAVTAVTALFAHKASAATASHCPGNADDVCFQWGVPESSSSSGSGNIYFQIEAPDSYAWVALGIGSGMSNSDMFVIYQDGSGNVTLSTREGRGHVMPQYSERSDVELLAGSGVVDNKMVANIRCSQCDSLTLDESNSWISAWKEGNSLDSTSTSASISQHDAYGVFSVDFGQASISSDSNPFVDSSNGDSDDSDNSDDSDDSGSDSSESSRGGGSRTGGDSDSSRGGGGAVTEAGGSGRPSTLIRAHGVLMSVIFVIGYPLGALLIPIFGKWYIHAGWQTLVFLGMWAGFGIGYHLSKMGRMWFNETHVQLGTIVVALMGIQPILGYLHHLHYVKHQRRGIVSHAHIWYGRILMILGIINGGLGLKLANTSRRFIIAYSVVAGVIAVVYTAGAFLGAMRRNRRQKIASPQMSQDERRRDVYG